MEELIEVLHRVGNSHIAIRTLPETGEIRYETVTLSENGEFRFVSPYFEAAQREFLRVVHGQEGAYHE